jgi:Zn-dependent protease with chaperone function
MYELLGICLSLVGLLAINSMASLLAAGLWRRISRAAESWPSLARAQCLFFLRIMPGLAAVFCVGALFIPSYLTNEPRHTTEVVTAKLGLLAAASLYGIGYALWRCIARCLATRRLTRDWLRHAQPILVENLSVPAFCFPHRFPVVAIVGALRPRLFIAEQVLEALSPEELSAAVAHERGHLAARDNFKRGLLLVCKDVLPLFPLGRSLDCAWMKAAEWAADDHAARNGLPGALDLASALVKIARLAPIGASPAMFAGASLIAEDLGGISSRVLRLTRLTASTRGPENTSVRWLNLAAGACIFGLVFTVLLSVSSSSLMAAIHTTLEYVVSAFQ